METVDAKILWSFLVGEHIDGLTPQGMDMNSAFGTLPSPTPTHTPPTSSISYKETVIISKVLSWVLLVEQLIEPEG